MSVGSGFPGCPRMAPRGLFEQARYMSAFGGKADIGARHTGEGGAGGVGDSAPCSCRGRASLSLWVMVSPAHAAACAHYAKTPPRDTTLLVLPYPLLGEH